MVDQAPLFTASSALELAIMVGVGLMTLSQDIDRPRHRLAAKVSTSQTQGYLAVQCGRQSASSGAVLPIAACRLGLGTTRLKATVDRASSPT